MTAARQAPGISQPKRACSVFRRWLVFNAVGAMGIAVQLAALMVVTGWMGVDYPVGTALAVESSVLHNFLWHERWTWADRQSSSRLDVFKRLLRFNLANGAFSIAGNVVAMRFLVGALAMNYLLANLVAIAACSILNFFASDWFVFSNKQAGGSASPDREEIMSHAIRKITAPVLLIITAFSAAPRLQAAELRPETAKAWEAYVQATEQRIARELASNTGFLALEFRNEAAGEKKNMLAGRIPVVGMKTLDSCGAEVIVPSGMIHHWRGSVFIPGATLNEILWRVEKPTADDTRQEDVIASKVLEYGPDSLRLYLKLQRSKFVTVVYNTEHLVRYVKYGENRASSSSIATKIAELENANTAGEREKPQGRDRGFLWRLNSYWRYEQVGGGVIVECESISLSRTVPSVLEFFIRPLIDKVAKESMQRTLASMRSRILLSHQKAVTQIADGRCRPPDGTCY